MATAIRSRCFGTSGAEALVVDDHGHTETSFGLAAFMRSAA